MSEIYIPPNCSVLASAVKCPQIRLGLQGAPGTGKTWAALTFPNPAVLNFDRGLGAHQNRTDIIEVPFYNPTFVDRIIPKSGLAAPPNRRDALIKWLSTEGQRISDEQTLIIDSNTQLQNAFHSEYRLNPVLTKKGAVDDYAEWNLKIIYFGEVMELIKSLKCNVVYVCHETADRNSLGELNNMVRPLLTGQFADQLASHFTDWFRCHAVAKPSSEKKEDCRKHFNLSQAELTEWLSSGSLSTMYVWQTQSDEIARHIKTSTLCNAPKYVLGNYKVFSQYKQK